MLHATQCVVQVNAYFLFWLYDGNLSFIITAVAIDRQAISYLGDQLIERLSRTQRKQWNRKQHWQQLAIVDIITRLRYLGKSHICSTSNAPLSTRYSSLADCSPLHLMMFALTLHHISCVIILKLCVLMFANTQEDITFAYSADGIILLVGASSAIECGRSAFALRIFYLL